MLDRLSQTRFFIKIDLKDTYHTTVKIQEKNKWKMAFRYKYGHFEYLVLPFGFTNTLAIFQTIVNEALKRFVDQIYIIFLDDILIYFKTLEKYIQYICNIFERLIQYNLFINLDKYNFHI